MAKCSDKYIRKLYFCFCRQDLNRVEDQVIVSITDMETWTGRIFEAIDSGSASTVSVNISKTDLDIKVIHDFIKLISIDDLFGFEILEKIER